MANPDHQEAMVSEKLKLSKASSLKAEQKQAGVCVFNTDAWLAGSALGGRLRDEPKECLRRRLEKSLQSVFLLVRAATMSRPILLKANILSSQLLDPAEISREKQTASSLNLSETIEMLSFEVAL